MNTTAPAVTDTMDDQAALLPAFQKVTPALLGILRHDGGQR